MKEYEIPWWKEWHEADTLERLDKVKKLNFVDTVMGIIKIEKIDEDMKKEMIATYLNGFFEDLESYLYVKLKGEDNEDENEGFKKIYKKG